MRFLISFSLFIFCRQIYSQEYSYPPQSLIELKYEMEEKGFPFHSIDSVVNLEGVNTYLVDSGIKVSKIISIGNMDGAIHQEDYKTWNEFKNTWKSRQKSDLNSRYYHSIYRIDTFYQLNQNLIIKWYTNRNQRFDINKIRLKSSDRNLNLSYIYEIAFRDHPSLAQMPLEKLKQRLQNIAFIEMIGEPEIKTLDSGVILNFLLKERKSNQFYAMVGLLSDAYNTGRIQLTGEAILSFQNLFRHGAYFDLNWQKSLSNSQFLFLKAGYPNIMNSLFGISSKFSLESIDSQYLRLTTDLSLEYALDWNQTIGLTYRNQSSSITVDKNTILNNRLPEFLDYGITQFGFSYKLHNMDKPLFTRRGILIESGALIGNKDIRINQEIENIKDNNGNSYKRLYDSIPMSQLLFSFHLAADCYIPVSKKITWKERLESKGILSENTRRNEMYFFGGIRRPRGFDDNLFLSSLYATSTHELQYYFSEFFYSNIFADITFMRSTLNSQTWNFPIGFGTGISLKSKGSIMSLSIAYGFSEAQSFSFNRSKIHISYVGLF